MSKVIFEVQYPIDEDAMNIIGTLIKDLEYYLGLSAKVVTGFERIESSIKGKSMMCKMLSSSMAHYRVIFNEKKSEILQLTLLSKKLLQSPKPSTIN